MTILIAGHSGAVNSLARVARALRLAGWKADMYFNGDVSALASRPMITGEFLLLGLSDVSFNNTLPGFYPERALLHAARQNDMPIGLCYGEYLAGPAPCFAELPIRLHIFFSMACGITPVSGPLIGDDGMLRVHPNDAPYQVIANEIIGTIRKS